MTRLRLPALAALLLLVPGALAAQEGKKGRAPSPIEQFLPRDTLVFVSVPDGRTALEILARTGEDRKALASRLAKRAGVRAEPLATLLEILAATADAPVTFSLHREVVVGRAAETHVLVTAATTRRGDALRDAGKSLTRTLLAPMFAKEVRANEVMGLPVLHLIGPDVEIYQAFTRGHLMYSTSSLLLGRVLKEMNSPKGKTLQSTPEYRGFRKRSGVEKGDGFLVVRSGPAVPLLGALEVRSGAAALSRDGDGFTDEAYVVMDGGTLGSLAREGTPPAALAGSAGRGAWVGVAVPPAAVLDLLLRVFDRAAAPALIPVGDAAAGGVEALLSPDGPPVFRIPLREDTDQGSLRHLGSLARVEGGSLLLSEDPDALAGAAPADPPAWRGDGRAGLRASVPFLLGLLGRRGATGGGTTSWAASRQEGAVHVTCGRGELGPFHVAVASLVR